MRHGRRRTVVIPPARPRIGKVGRFDLAHGGTVFLDEVGTLAARPPGEVRALRERGRSSVSAACAPRRWNPSTIAARAAPDLSPVRRTLRSAAGSNARCRPLEAEVRVRVSTQVDILHFSTTWSARTSTDCGIVSPSAFAVLRLITSSNLVGCRPVVTDEVLQFRRTGGRALTRAGGAQFRSGRRRRRSRPAIQ